MNLIDHPSLPSLLPAASGRACRRCRGPISLDDGFGLSEGVCRSCLLVPYVVRQPRRLAARLRLSRL